MTTQKTVEERMKTNLQKEISNLDKNFKKIFKKNYGDVTESTSLCSCIYSEFSHEKKKICLDH